MDKDHKSYLVEFIATFALIFIGAGAVTMDAVSNGGVTLVGVALAHGLVLMAMIYATGHISGAHVNPAVTLAMWITKNIKAKKAVFYMISQLLGAALGGFLLMLVFPMAPESVHLGTTALAPDVTFVGGVLVEAILTFFLVFVIFGVAVDKRAPAGMYGLAIGLVLTFDIIVGGPLTGAAMNPARAFGPAIASGFFVDHLVYWIGPMIGAIVAAAVHMVLKK